MSAETSGMRGREEGDVGWRMGVGHGEGGVKSKCFRIREHQEKVLSRGG